MANAAIDVGNSVRIGDIELTVVDVTRVTRIYPVDGDARTPGRDGRFLLVHLRVTSIENTRGTLSTIAVRLRYAGDRIPRVRIRGNFTGVPRQCGSHSTRTIEGKGFPVVRSPGGRDVPALPADGWVAFGVPASFAPERATLHVETRDRADEVSEPCSTPIRISDPSRVVP